MKKNILNWSLTAAILCGLSLSVTACSDDDDKDKTDEQEQTVMPSGDSDDATVLAWLLSAWVEEFADKATSDILSKQYEATVGEADAAQQTVRSMVVGTQEQADAYARQVLSIVGATSGSIDGFSYSNAALGSLSYRHGTGNDLGIIDVSVKQLPGLTRLRLLRQADTNVDVVPYYQKGDIVKYSKDGKYYICLQDHEGGANAVWVSFDCGDDVKKQTVGTCGWLGTGDDHYFKDNQAKPQNLSTWLQEFILSNEGYNEVILHLRTLRLPMTVINQIVPSSAEMRNRLVESITTTPRDEVLDVNTPHITNGLRDLRASDVWPYRDNGDVSPIVRTFYPFGLLLAGPARWKMGLTFQYWVPNMVLVEHVDSEGFEELLRETSSQHREPAYFKYDCWSRQVRFGSKFYDIYTVAAHWTHVPFRYSDDLTYKCLVNFVENRRSFDGKTLDPTQVSDLDWTLHNITSHELSVKDNGRKYKYFETVYRGKDL